jgi:hypothetical protein
MKHNVGKCSSHNIFHTHEGEGEFILHLGEHYFGHVKNYNPYPWLQKTVKKDHVPQSSGSCTEENKPLYK